MGAPFGRLKMVPMFLVSPSAPVPHLVPVAGACEVLLMRALGPACSELMGFMQNGHPSLHLAGLQLPSIGPSLRCFQLPIGYGHRPQVGPLGEVILGRAWILGQDAWREDAPGETGHRMSPSPCSLTMHRYVFVQRPAEWCGACA